MPRWTPPSGAWLRRTAISVGLGRPAAACCVACLRRAGLLQERLVARPSRLLPERCPALLLLPRKAPPPACSPLPCITAAAPAVALQACVAALAGYPARLPIPPLHHSRSTLPLPCRRVWLPSLAKAAIASDTVGFISDLPHQLVEAFKVGARCRPLHGRTGADRRPASGWEWWRMGGGRERQLEEALKVGARL